MPAAPVLWGVVQGMSPQESEQSGVRQMSSRDSEELSPTAASGVAAPQFST